MSESQSSRSIILKDLRLAAPVPLYSPGRGVYKVIGFEFDDEYLKRLSRDDPATAEHFGIYFGQLLNRKLRCRCRNPELLEDVRQETLRRVLEAVRKGELSSPKRLEAFACAVCNHVLFEYW